MSNIQALDKVKHGAMFVNLENQLEHLNSHNIVPICVGEFLEVGTNLPIFFAKDSATGAFRPVALMGFDNDENLIFGKHYVHSNYIPMHIRKYPFSIARVGASDEICICIDEDSKCLNSEGKGYRLFNGESPSDNLEKVSHFLTELATHDSITEQFINDLTHLELIEEASLTLTLGELGRKQLNGLYKVNAEKLENTPAEVLCELHGKKYLPAIYSQLASMFHIKKLINLKARSKT